MEAASKECISLFKRLIVYHCFRENKYAKGSSTYLNKIYGKNFITEGAVQKWFKIFKDKDDSLNFDDLCSLTYANKKKRVLKPVPADPPPLDDDLEAVINGGESEDGEDKGGDESKEKKKKKGGTAGFKPKPKFISGEGMEDDDELELKTNLDRSEKRKLILRCYKAKYTVGETNRYLNSIHGKGFINKTSVYTWYKRFEQKDFKLGDKNRSGRPQKVDENKGKEIIEFIETNPTVNLRNIAAQFKLSTGTLSRLLPKLGFQYVVDKWVKTDTRRPEVTDEEMRSFKEQNPLAKVKDVAEHFMISRIIVAQRLRKLGFDIPKWPKKKKPGEVTLGPDGLPMSISSGRRRGRPSKDGRGSVEANLVNSHVNHDMSISTSLSSTAMPPSLGVSLPSIHAIGNSGITGPVDPNGQHMNNQQQINDNQQYGSIMQLATTTAVNSLLPAVLRRKTNPILPQSHSPIKSVPPNNIANQMTVIPVSNAQGGPPQMAENLSTNRGQIDHHREQQQQQGAPNSQVIVNSNGYHMQGPSGPLISGPLNGPGGNPYGMLQNLVGGGAHPSNPPTSGAGGQHQQGPQQQQSNPHAQQPDPLHNFDPYNPPLDNLQVQNILHPYYQ